MNTKLSTALNEKITERLLDPIQRATAFAVIESGVRWSQNILAEISGNYARFLPKEAREHLKQASQSLLEFSQVFASHQNECKKLDSTKF